MTAAPAPDVDFRGRHVLSEFYDVDPTLLNDTEFLRVALQQALKEANATLLHMIDHTFESQGATVVALLSESHASVHTWPEQSACFIDFFTCGQADPERALQVLRAALRPARYNVLLLDRGTPGSAPPLPHHPSDHRKAAHT
ncbi:adenosylmethionine decarboxylase [Nonomuraea maheshkhaliensis]|uniref:S-adenosylmethionine decarboxylase proenzyme n=1 Tax=Nonomuraea maheshkhaliensis TaxID=419590 RepID=A0ABN2ENK5_9ACTN